VSVYALVVIVRKRLALEMSLYQILQISSVTLFERTPILQALQPSDGSTSSRSAPRSSLCARKPTSRFRLVGGQIGDVAWGEPERFDQPCRHYFLSIVEGQYRAG
jgi:hypothetical protein